MKSPKILLFLLVFFICLVIGFLSSSTLWEQWGTFLNRTENNSLLTTSPTVTTSFVLIGADDLTCRYAIIESIWLVQFRQDQTDIVLKPIFPRRLDPYFNKNVAGSFKLDKWCELPQNFWQAIAEVGLPNQKYVLIDQFASEQIIDMFGGIELEGIPYRGQDALAEIPSWIDNPIDAQERQGELIDAVCQALSRGQISDPYSTLTYFDELMPKHLNTNMDQIQLAKDWLRFAALDGNLKCSLSQE